MSLESITKHIDSNALIGENSNGTFIMMNVPEIVAETISLIYPNNYLTGTNNVNTVNKSVSQLINKNENTISLSNNNTNSLTGITDTSLTLDTLVYSSINQKLTSVVTQNGGIGFGGNTISTEMYSFLFYSSNSQYVGDGAYIPLIFDGKVESPAFIIGGMPVLTPDNTNTKFSNSTTRTMCVMVTYNVIWSESPPNPSGILVYISINGSTSVYLGGTFISTSDNYTENIGLTGTCAMLLHPGDYISIVTFSFGPFQAKGEVTFINVVKLA